MIQNLFLSVEGTERLLIASNPSCEFTKYLQEKLKEPCLITRPFIQGIMNNFDSKERNGVVFRGELLNWLWERENKEIVCELE